MSQFEYPIWISILFWYIPLTIVVWLIGMWATHEDYKKEHNIKGWSDKDMNAKQIILTSILSFIVGTTGWLGGVYYGSLSMFDTMYANVGQELDLLETKLENVSTKKIESQLEQLKIKVLNKVPSQQDVINMSKQVDEINTRIEMLATETQSLLTDLKFSVIEDLNKTTTDLTNKVDNTITAQSDSVKKEFGKLYDRLDVIYKDLEKISDTIDTAKETFLGKYIIKE
jgi:5-bromo-4-chloroindolyl phosphate hydrolysis protein